MDIPIGIARYWEMKTIWKWLDGNKTIIGLVLLNITQLTFVKEWLGPNLTQIQAIIGAFTGYGALSHAKKGKFTTKNN